MGGYGSGGWNATGRLTTADVPNLNVNVLNKEGVLLQDFDGTLRWTANEYLNSAIAWFCSKRNVLSIAHSATGRTEEISISWEPCRFGGHRPFFCCPGCHGLALHLYQVSCFRCRRCHGLSYLSQRERGSDRAQRRANQIRVRLGGEPGWLNIPTKPKCMHERTYMRLIDEIIEADEVTSKFVEKFLRLA